MRWIKILFSLFLKKMSEGAAHTHPLEDLKEFLKENSIKLLIGLSLVIALGTLLSAGVFMFITHLSAQLEKGLSPVMNASAWGALIMVMIPCLLFGLAWFKSGAHSKKLSDHNEILEEPVKLETALVMLVMDFIEERKIKREQELEQQRRLFEAKIKEGAFKNEQAQEEEAQGPSSAKH